MKYIKCTYDAWDEAEEKAKSKKKRRGKPKYKIAKAYKRQN